MVIKKIIVIILLMLLIVANVQICFGESIDGIYSYNQSYGNISTISNGYDLNNYFVYNLEGVGSTMYDTKYNLTKDGLSNYYSRYNSGLVHVYFHMYFTFRPQFILTSPYVANSYKPLNNNPTFTIENDLNWTILNPSIDWSVNVGDVGEDSSGLLFMYYDLSLNIEFDTYLKDLLLTGVDYSSQLINVTCHDSGLGFILYNNDNQICGYQRLQYFRSWSWAEYGFVLDNAISNVKGGAFGFDLYHYQGFTGDTNFTNSNNVYTCWFNNVGGSKNEKSYISGMVNYNINESSRIKSMNCRSQVNTDWGIINDNYQELYNESSSQFTYDNTRFELILALMPPVFSTDSQPVVNPYQENMTPLKLQYYDAKWYEIHLQLANAFIFMITEFPLVSDITNLIYSLFIMIKNSFDVLLNFNGFGILFGFGMFAIVFGFIYKLIVGD